MFLRFENLALLFGLFALAVPIVLHLLQRRRFDVLDWGAMQFLPDSIVAQRRRWLDELVLMLLRMGLIALIVLALATPISTSTWLDTLTDRATRDIVLVFDGSYSMDVRSPNQPTPWDDAIRQALTQIDDAEIGDRFAVVIARRPPFVWRGEFTTDLDLRAMPTPRGNPDSAAGLAAAWKLLKRSTAPSQEIRVFTDRQRHGWTDSATLAALDTLGGEWRTDIERAKNDGGAIPSIRIVPCGSESPKKPPNHALAPLQLVRGVAKVGQPVTIQSTLHLPDVDARRKVHALVDGTPIEELPLGKFDAKQSVIPLKFTHTFAKEGQHVISFALDVDPAHDVLRADNEQHAVIDVVKELPILLVDGDRQLGPESSTFFLQQALNSREAKNAPALPFTNVKPDDLTKPAVVVLADVPRLDAEQLAALERFLAAGGGLLIAVGERAEHAFYNQQPWMPAKLTGVGVAQDGVYPEAREFQHSTLTLLRDINLSHIRFTQWTGVQLAANERAAATLSNEAPLVIEKPYKRGRVILMTVPLDRRWGSTFPSASEFPILMHELTQYLAGLSGGSSVLDKGESIRVSSIIPAPTQLTLKTPEIDRSFDVKQWPWTYDNTGAIGVYQARLADGQTRSFVVRPDLAEADLTRCSDDDWRWVQARLPIVWQTESTTNAEVVQTPRAEVWWIFLLAVLAFLCVELWMTRRLALARGG